MSTLRADARIYDQRNRLPQGLALRRALGRSRPDHAQHQFQHVGQSVRAVGRPRRLRAMECRAQLPVRSRPLLHRPPGAGIRHRGRRLRQRLPAIFLDPQPVRQQFPARQCADPHSRRIVLLLRRRRFPRRISRRHFEAAGDPDQHLLADPQPVLRSAGSLFHPDRWDDCRLQPVLPAGNLGGRGSHQGRLRPARLRRRPRRPDQSRWQHRRPLRPDPGQDDRPDRLPQRLLVRPGAGRKQGRQGSGRRTDGGRATRRRRARRCRDIAA